MPEEFDIAIIEGAVTTEEAVRQVKQLREKAEIVITIGACAHTAGIPGMAAQGFEGRIGEVYDTLPEACGTVIEPRAVKDVIDVDYAVLSCPIDFYEFAQVLSAALHGSNRHRRSTTMCAECKRQENLCFYPRGEICLGMVTNGGCMARCPHFNIRKCRLLRKGRLELGTRLLELRPRLFERSLRLMLATLDRCELRALRFERIVIIK